MPDTTLWMGESTHVIDAAERAVLALRRIMAFPTTIMIARVGVGAQIVRLEYNNIAQETDANLSAPGVASAIVFGIRNHPSLPDTDLVRGDRFRYLNTMFEVISVTYVPGEIQAHCQAKST